MLSPLSLTAEPDSEPASTTPITSTTTPSTTTPSTTKTAMPTYPAGRSTLVLIIDDIGNHRDRDSAVLALPGKLNVAILPHRPWGYQIASEAPAADKEVMLHAPMTSLSNIALGEGGLTPEQSEQQFRETLAAALEAVPNVRGINNHMGSALTQQWEPMVWVMGELRQRGLYFVDSRTSESSVAAMAAQHLGIPNLSRRVFLDNQRDEQAISNQLAKALTIARREGLAVVIGHPYPETTAVLQRQLPLLMEQGVQLAWVSEVLAARGEGLEPDFHAPVGHELFGLGHGKLPEVEYTGGQHSIGSP